jgi:hypothetical protein
MNSIEITGVRENDLIPVCGGEPEESRFLLCEESANCNERQEQDQKTNGSSHRDILSKVEDLPEQTGE